MCDKNGCGSTSWLVGDAGGGWVCTGAPMVESEVGSRESRAGPGPLSSTARFSNERLSECRRIGLANRYAARPPRLRAGSPFPLLCSRRDRWLGQR
jgi:hypothetical protein